LISGEQVLNQWTSEECASDCCGNINYVTLTDQRILIRYDGCDAFSWKRAVLTAGIDCHLI